MEVVNDKFEFNPNDYIKKKEDKVKRKKYYKSSTSVGAHIVNAETGQVYEHLVGSTDECRYYTVMINEGKEGIKLFYNSPEQYESHRNTELDDNLKVEWHNKEHERRVLEFNKDDEETTNGPIVIK